MYVLMFNPVSIHPVHYSLLTLPIWLDHYDNISNVQDSITLESIVEKKEERA